MKKIFFFLLVGSLLFSAAACSHTQKADGPIVAATTAPLCQFASALCQGTDITVKAVISEPVSCLHDYSLTVGQMRTVTQADCVLISGAGLENFMDDALNKAGNVIDCSQGISLLTLDGEDDPHIWLAPENAAKMTDNAAAQLSLLYPQWAEKIETNRAQLSQEFEALQKYGETALESLSCRELVTFHDGFAYFAAAFDLSILSSVEEEAGSEASAADLERITLLVTEHQLPAIFTEENGSDAAAKVISRETGCAIFPLSTALSGGDYFETIRKNIDTLQEAMA